MSETPWTDHKKIHFSWADTTGRGYIILSEDAENFEKQMRAEIAALQARVKELESENAAQAIEETGERVRPMPTFRWTWNEEFKEWLCVIGPIKLWAGHTEFGHWECSATLFCPGCGEIITYEARGKTRKQVAIETWRRALEIAFTMTRLTHVRQIQL